MVNLQVYDTLGDFFFGCPEYTGADKAEKMNIEHRTLNVQHRIMYSDNFKKDWAKRNYPSKFCRLPVLK
jgi:hypothetical protein